MKQDRDNKQFNENDNDGMQQVEKIKKDVMEKLAGLRTKRQALLQDFLHTLEQRKIEHIRNLILRK